MRFSTERILEQKHPRLQATRLFAMTRGKQPTRTKPVFLVVRTAESCGYWLAQELPGEDAGLVRVQWLELTDAVRHLYRLLNWEHVIEEESIICADVSLVRNGHRNEYQLDGELAATLEAGCLAYPL